MGAASHLKSLQAIEMAIRFGSLRAAGDHLGISPAAVGQRIRSLEIFLGKDLLVRGRSGLMPTAELARALEDLRAGFSALDRATEALEFQRVSEIHIVADVDWAELWLQPRLSEFRATYPNIGFCINGLGDVPLRLGAPDCRIEYGEPGKGEVLFFDCLLPVSGHDNLRRIVDRDETMPLEGLPFLHLEAQRDDPLRPGWPDWVARFGNRREGAGRGMHYRHAQQALEAVRDEVGFLICGWSLIARDLPFGNIVMPYPPDQCLVAPRPYVLKVTALPPFRPQLSVFCDWLRAQAALTRASLPIPATTSCGS